MHRQIRSCRPSPALVIACLALIVALSGSAYAATKLLAHSARYTGYAYSFGPATLAVAASDNSGIAIPVFSVAKCPPRLHAIGGGWKSADTTQDPISITTSEASRGDWGWLVVAKDTSTATVPDNFVFQAFAICA